MTTQPTVTLRPPVHYFGSAVALISTLNTDGTSHLTPISSTWSLDGHYMLGMARWHHGTANLERTGECVINFPDTALHSAVERIADTTGSDPRPQVKRLRYRTVKDKWTLAGLSPTPSEVVAADRVPECPVQIEASLHNVIALDDDFAAYHVRVRCVHVHQRLRLGKTDRVDVEQWQPLYYTFRHYFAQGVHLGRTFKADD